LCFWQVLLRHGPWAVDLLLGLLMLSSALIMTLYVGVLAPTLNPQASYSTYDAVETAAARWFLPRKDSSPAAAASAAAAAASGAVNTTTSSMSSSGGVNGVVTPASLQLPGGSGRWLLPDADGDMDALARLLSGVSRCTAAWSAYGLVQCLVLLLFLLQLLVAWSFQPRLGIITQTLVAALPAIAHLCLVIAFCMVAFAAVLTLAVGTWAAPTATLSSAWYDMFLLLLAGSEVDLGTLFPPGVVLTSAQQLLSGLILYMREALFAFVLMSYFLAALGATFAAVKKAATASAKAASAGMGRDTGRRTIVGDLVVYVFPEWLAAVRPAAWQLQGQGSSTSSSSSYAAQDADKYGVEGSSSSTVQNSSGSGAQEGRGKLETRWASSRAGMAGQQVRTEARPSQLDEEEEQEEVATTLEGPPKHTPNSTPQRSRNMQPQQQQQQRRRGVWSCRQLEAWLPAGAHGPQQQAAYQDLSRPGPRWLFSKAPIASSVQFSAPCAALDPDALQTAVVSLVLEDQQRSGAGGRGATGAALAAELMQQALLRQSPPQPKSRKAAARRSTYGGEVMELPPDWQESLATPRGQRAAARVAAGPGPDTGAATAQVAAAAEVAASVLRALGVHAPPAAVTAGQALLQQEGFTLLDLGAHAGTSSARAATPPGGGGSSRSAWDHPSTEVEPAMVTLTVTRRVTRPDSGAPQGQVQQQVFAALWVAVSEMQQWAAAATKWHKHVAREMALWCWQVQQLAAHHREGARGARPGSAPSPGTAMAAPAARASSSSSSSSGRQQDDHLGVRRRRSSSSFPAIEVAPPGAATTPRGRVQSWADAPARRQAALGGPGPIGSGDGSSRAPRSMSASSVHLQQQQQQPRRPAALVGADHGRGVAGSFASVAVDAAAVGSPGVRGSAGLEAIKHSMPASLRGRLLAISIGTDGLAAAEPGTAARAPGVMQPAQPLTTAARAGRVLAPASAAALNTGMPISSSNSRSSSHGNDAVGTYPTTSISSSAARATPAAGSPQGQAPLGDGEHRRSRVPR
jgi:hypothetical protein